MTAQAPIQLELDPSEALLLDEALQRMLHTMRVELVHAEHREFRQGVREQLDALEAIEQRLAALTHA